MCLKLVRMSKQRWTSDRMLKRLTQSLIFNKDGERIGTGSTQRLSTTGICESPGRLDHVPDSIPANPSPFEFGGVVGSLVSLWRTRFCHLLWSCRFLTPPVGTLHMHLVPAAWGINAGISSVFLHHSQQSHLAF